MKTICSFFAAVLILPASVLSQSTDIVNFYYSPPKWQTAICLPDDPNKSLVDKSGALLYDYIKGGHDFGTQIMIEVAGDAVWKKQELLSPKVPVVKTYRSADGLNIVEEAFAINGPIRSDIILVRVTNTGKKSHTLHPKLIVNTKFDLQLSDQRVIINKNETLTSSLRITGFVNESQLQLSSLTVPVGQSDEFSICYNYNEEISTNQGTVEQAIEYWEKLPLPYNRIVVPDTSIQALINSSIRNIWQAREIKEGIPVFQVGPTIYRGLWIVDGAFMLEAATMLGAGDQARNGVAYELTHQQTDGRIEVMKDFSKENGIVLWTCFRHAQLTQDKAWLESIWPNLERIAEYIKLLRQETLKNNSPLDDGLMPAGFPDGGIGGIRDEYTNTYWNLVGVHSFVEGAQWLGKATLAAIWKKEYEDFMATFQKAASRDMRKDANGNLYLPILIGNEGSKELPQRAQWAFCHAVYPGQIFANNDSLVAGILAMLEATEREGMVYGTGWDSSGIWNYFASFYGHALLWQGNGRKAAQALYAFANHASPTLVWREEQSLKNEKFRKIGDMPHNWASAEFIRLTTHLLELDRGKELHLLEGFPNKWAAPGMVTQLNGIQTPFGTLFMDLQISADGQIARLKVKKLEDRPIKIVLHLEGLTGEDTIRELPLDKDIDITIPVKISKD